MKVALIIHSNILDKVDGMANYYRKFCEYASASNDKIDIFLLSNHPEKEIKEKSVRFTFVQATSSFQTLPKAFLPVHPGFYLKLMWYFHRTFKKEKYDCIQISFAHPFCLVAVLIAKRLNIPVIGSYHTLFPEYVPYWTMQKFNSFPFGKMTAKVLHLFVILWTRIVYSTADLILTPTPKVKSSLRKKFPKTRIEVIGRGVNSALFKPQRKGHHKLRLIYVGRVSVEKNLQELSFLGKHRDLHFIIVGEGSDLDRIKKVLPFAEFKGKLTNKELSREYGFSDVFVFPSKTDAYANVVSEALSCGLPVVAYDDAGVEDRVEDGVNGFLVSTIEEFEAAIVKLKNEALRKKLSQHARHTAQNLKWESVFNQQLNAFDLAIEEYHNKLRRFFPILRKVIYSFNFSHAILGSLRMGFYIFLANVSAGILEGISAGLRQSSISFLMVGINTSFFEFLYFRSRRLSILLPSLLTTTVATTIHTLRGTPNIITTAATIFGLALFNFIMLSEIHKRHATISPWELIKIISNYLIRSLRHIKLKVTPNV
jgi:glycosyltransferase involved in cell wall biosynthesis